MSSSQQYQALPVDEKLGGEQSSSPPQRKWSKTRQAFVFSLLFLLSLTLVTVTARALTRPTPVSETSIKEQDKAAESMLKEHLTRASGDTYLIGVGKADITGYMTNCRLYAHFD